MLYQYTCYKVLSKFKVPYQLLVHGVQDSVTLNICCEEICYTIKTGEKLAVPCHKLRSGSQNQIGTRVPWSFKQKIMLSRGTIFGRNPISPDLE